MTDQISDLRMFARMVAAGSLSETARRLNSSPAGVSRRLAAIESRLGVRLVDRNSRRFALTAEGAFYHKRALHILAELDDAEAEIGAQAKRPYGQLRVGVPLEIGRRRLASLIAEFTREFPDIGVELMLSDSCLDVIGDELDVLLHLDVPTDNTVVARKLLTDRRVVCASPIYLSAHGVPEKPGDLLEHDCIRLVRGRQLFDRWSFKEAGRLREVQVRGRLSTNNAEVMHGWALLGCGICFKAMWDIEEDLREGRLAELLLPYACDEISLYASYATRRFLPPRIRVFIDFIAAALARNGTSKTDSSSRRARRASSRYESLQGKDV